MAAPSRCGRCSIPAHSDREVSIANGGAEVRRVVERSFREHWREIVLVLTRRFTPANLDLIESAVQEAMIRAMETWPERGVPDNPGGWIKQVARNRIIDSLRRNTAFAAKTDEIARRYYPRSLDEDPIGPLEDDALKMMLICCHPVLGRRAQVALILRTLSGFGTREIARAFLSRGEAVRKLLTRAKQRIRDHNLSFNLPTPAALEARLDGVLDAIYLLFNEGYMASRGARLVREELCVEAMRLTELILASRIAGAPKVYAIAALMSFQASRLAARSDDSGRLVLIADQDRGRWDQALIRRGVWLLAQSQAAPRRSPYHLQAAIAACHAIAPTYEATDWPRIRDLYDDLLDLTGSPIVAVNRVVAVMMTDGESAALVILDELRADLALRDSHHVPALTAEALRRQGQNEAARVHYERAIALAGNEPLRAFLRRRLQETEFDYA